MENSMRFSADLIAISHMLAALNITSLLGSSIADRADLARRSGELKAQSRTCVSSKIRIYWVSARKGVKDFRRQGRIKIVRYAEAPLQEAQAALIAAPGV